eukprot:3162144-Prymnesium_polylepis.1
MHHAHAPCGMAQTGACWRAEGARWGVRTGRAVQRGAASGEAVRCAVLATRGRRRTDNGEGVGLAEALEDVVEHGGVKLGRGLIPSELLFRAAEVGHVERDLPRGDGRRSTSGVVVARTGRRWRARVVGGEIRQPAASAAARRA